jgi:tRNA-binding EMAP/Myf-like protein
MKITVKENSKNYACSVVEIKNLFPIEGADKIQRCNINGNDVIVSKDIKLGDKMLYFVSGTKLNVDFCKFNNLLTDKEQNKDVTKVGYISHKQFRVKAIKLKGVISDGVLLPIESLSFNESIKYKYLMVGDEFTDIDNISLCEKYFVPVINSNQGRKAPKQPKRISRLIENQFFLHGDTDNLRKNIHKINPSDIIGIHYKKHGTSIVLGNVLVKKNLKWYERVAKKLGLKVVDTEYDIVYSSRNVVKNQYLNTETGSGFYGEDIWGVVVKQIGHLIPKNWTLYGEIIGYTQSGAYIQQDFDYGCEKGQHKFYVYKISVINPDGNVVYLTDNQIEEYCEKVGLLYKDTFIYYGKACEWLLQYDDVCWIGDEDFRTQFLEKLEKEYNEKDCYMCVNKVPEEGIVIRVQKLYEYEAYKLKSKRFLLKESDLQEKDVTNIEDNQLIEENA